MRANKSKKEKSPDKSEKNLMSFLTLGYFLDFNDKKYFLDFSGIEKEKYKDTAEDDLVKKGSSLWREALASNFSKGHKHVVPLSGGLDSRAILAGLLEHTEGKNIYTYTFGTPGTLDFEIGNQLAKKLGTKHTCSNLDEYEYKQENLEDISKRICRQTILFHHWPVHETDSVFPGCDVWSGFLGDFIVGGHLYREPARSLNGAARNFLEKNRYAKSVELAKKDVDFTGLMDADLIESEKLTFEEQLDFRNRQLKYIAPHVLIEGYDYKLPFLHPPWMNFMLSIDNALRYNMRLYKSILMNSFPGIFSYMTKHYRGLSFREEKVLESEHSSVLRKFMLKNKRKVNIALKKLDSKRKHINYIDFGEGIRNRKDLRDIIRNNIHDLNARRIIDWLDITEILNGHMEGQAEHAEALIVLCSLEIHLKTGKSI